MRQDDGRSLSVEGDDDRFARLAAQLLRSAWQEAPPRVTASPRLLVTVIENELRARRRRRIIGRWAEGAAAAAVVATLVFGGTWRVARLAAGGRPSLDPRALRIVSNSPPDDAGAPAAPTSPVRPGMRLVAPVERALRLSSPNGTELTLEAGGVLTVVDVGETQRFTLLRGAVLVHVTKLGPGERFVLDTSDAEVEVHGTRFRVASDAESSYCGVRSATRVSVLEGVVTVVGPAGLVRLSPGQQWPSPCPAPPTVGSGSTPRGRGESPSREADPPPIALRAQNELYMAGMLAKQRGDITEALRVFERFMRKYPDSPLVEGAAVERIRLLSLYDGRAAAKAAAAYLAHFPDGVARREAQRLVGVARP